MDLQEIEDVELGVEKEEGASPDSIQNLVEAKVLNKQKHSRAPTALAFQNDDLYDDASF